MSNKSKKARRFAARVEAYWNNFHREAETLDLEKGEGKDFDTAYKEASRLAFQAFEREGIAVSMCTFDVITPSGKYFPLSDMNPRVNEIRRRQ